MSNQNEAAIAAHAAAMEAIRSEAIKTAKAAGFDATNPGDADGPRASVFSAALQVSHNTWSQVHQAEFNRAMAELQAQAQSGGGIAIPRRSVLGG